MSDNRCITLPKIGLSGDGKMKPPPGYVWNGKEFVKETVSQIEEKSTPTVRDGQGAAH